MRPAYFLVVVLLLTGGTLSRAAGPNSAPASADLRATARTLGVEAQELAEKQPTQALVLARRWAELEPLEAMPRVFIAQLWLRLGAPAAALEYCDQALRLSAHADLRRQALLISTQAQLALGRYPSAWSAASSLARELEEAKSPEAPAIRKMAWAIFARLQEPEALESLRKGVVDYAQAHPAEAPAVIRAANLLEQTGRVAEAGDLLGAPLSLKWAQLAERWEPGAPAAAEPLRVPLSTAKVDVSLLVRLAELLLNVEAVPKPGQVEQARALVDAAALRKGDPMTVAALRARLSGETAPARKPDEASDEARRQAALARVEKAVAVPAITPDEVLRVTDEAFAANARSPLILASRWQACRKLDLEAEALRVAAIGLALDPAHPALKEPGDWLWAQLGEVRSLYTAARGLRKDGKTKEALDALERVLQIDPAFGDARLELAGVLAALDVREAAIFHLELALAAGLSPSLERQAVAVATELGAWRALFSLAGRLSEIHPRDAEMQHLRAIAATALGRTSFVLETAGALTEHPIYGVESWALCSAARVIASSKKLATPPYFNVSSRHLSP
ncbi:MAG: hypothetical protein K0Q72_4161, partial [Armatimonadetes bacterium]|nr:hypothetical protein [Armatimonadota bacterium]